MAHTYASIAQLKDFIKDHGSDATGSGGLGTTNDALFLMWLEDASRTMDVFCGRTSAAHTMSGFGPRIGTNRYDGTGTDSLRLFDDLIGTPVVTVLASTGGTSSTYTDETDFYRLPYDGTPKRELRCHGLTSKNVWPVGLRTVDVASTWGYTNDPVVSTTTVASGLSSGTTATTFTTSASPTISPGNTLLIGSEHLYLTGLSSTTATVDRGANGSTAATHVDTSAISVYRYDRRVATTCLRLAFRRWKLRDSGSSGPMLVPGGGALPDPSELAILWNGIGSLRMPRSN